MRAALRHRVSAGITGLLFALVLLVEPAAAFAADDAPSEGPTWLYGLMVLGLAGIVAGVVIGRRQPLDDEDEADVTDEDGD